MSKYYGFYEPNSGEIVKVTYGSHELATEVRPVDTNIIESDEFIDIRAVYVAAGKIIERPAMVLDISPGTDLDVDEEITISGLPPETLVVYPGGEEVIYDGDISWSSSVAGNFTFVFKRLPWVEEEIYVEVT